MCFKYCEVASHFSYSVKIIKKNLNFQSTGFKTINYFLRGFLPFQKKIISSEEGVIPMTTEGVQYHTFSENIRPDSKSTNSKYMENILLTSVSCSSTPLNKSFPSFKVLLMAVRPLKVLASWFQLHQLPKQDFYSFSAHFYWLGIFKSSFLASEACFTWLNF